MGKGGGWEDGQDPIKLDLVRSWNVTLRAVRLEDFRVGIEFNSLQVVLLGAFL